MFVLFAVGCDTTGNDVVVKSVTDARTNVNGAPVVDLPSTLTVAVQTEVAIVSRGENPASALLQFSWEQISGLPVVLRNIDQRTVNFLAPADIGTVALRLTVTNSSGQSSVRDITVTVVASAAVNQPPSVDAGPDQSVHANDIVQVNGFAFDRDGTISSLQWQVVSPTNTVLTSTASLTTGFTAPAVSSAQDIILRLTVTDNAGASVYDEVKITVYPLVTLSGRFRAASTAMRDSDVNDPDAEYIGNDTLAQAQVLPNPTILGGYVNTPGAGPAGRSQDGTLARSDIDDYFRLSLNANEYVNLHIGETYGATPQLALMLLDSNGTVVTDSVAIASQGALSIRTSHSGNYYALVRALSGAASYVLTAGAASAAMSDGWSSQSEFVPGELIVEFNDDSAFDVEPDESAAVKAKAQSADLKIVAGAAGRSALVQLNASTMARSKAQDITTRDIDAQSKLDTVFAAAELARRSDIKSVRLNYINRPTLNPNDPLFDLQWNFSLINLPAAWDVTVGGDDVIVAVLDTGVLPAHPDIDAANRFVDGYDFVSNDSNAADGQRGIDPDPTDPGDGGSGHPSSFHGTFVSGIIAASTNNNVGVSGIGWNVKIMPLRVLGTSGGTDYDLEQAIRYAVGLPNDSGTIPTRRADIINMSLGRPATSLLTPSIYRLAREAGAILIAAAGNEGRNNVYSPAIYPEVVAVSAVNAQRQIAEYSNFGSSIDIAAPGGDWNDLNGDGYPDLIIGTSANDTGGTMRYEYSYRSGTSIAAPHVAGIVALMKSVNPNLTPAQFDTMLQSGQLTHDLGVAGRDDHYGHGLIDASRAVNAATSATPLPPLGSPQLQVSPGLLQFGAVLDSLTLSVNNAAQGELRLNRIVADAPWVNIAPANVDAGGLGTYTVSIDRTGLADGNYSSVITINTSARDAAVTVSMQVLTSRIVRNIGAQYVELFDAATRQVLDKQRITPVNDDYVYAFTGVRIGRYGIHAGTDSDNDGKLCELGEACGAYPTLDRNSNPEILIDGSNTRVGDLNFETGFSLQLIPR